MELSEVFHVTFDVISAVEPSEYFPVAVNWSVEFTTNFEEAGVTAIEDNVIGCLDADVGLDEQAVMVKLKIAINPKAR